MASQPATHRISSLMPRHSSPQHPENPIVVWGGDVNLGRRQHYRAAELGAQNVLAPVSALQEADLAIVNLECVVTTGGEQGRNKQEGGPYYYRARPEMLNILKYAGVNVVTTANNHSGDYGWDAQVEQRHWLAQAGIEAVGSGDTRQQAFAPLIRAVGDLSVALFSVDTTMPLYAATESGGGNAYLAPNDPDTWRSHWQPLIEAARCRAHVVLIAIHWGKNFVSTPEEKQRALGRALIDAGADAVLGASAHVLQGVEIHRGKPIIHDAGDLLFDSKQTELRDSAVFQMELNANGVRKLKFIPLGVGFGYSTPLAGEMAREACARFVTRSQALGTALIAHPDGSAHIDLSPLPRPVSTATQTPAQAPAVFPSPSLPDAKLRRWQPDHPPEATMCDTVHMGPVELVGYRVEPQGLDITSRQMIWVETFWRCKRPLNEDWRLDIRAVPQDGAGITWGIGMDHDPCDWLIPTSRWMPGRLYRDRYGLRPPSVRAWCNGSLRIELAWMAGRDRIHVTPLPVSVTLAMPGRPPAPPLEPSSTRYRNTFDQTQLQSPDGSTWTADQLVHVTGGQWACHPGSDWRARSVVLGIRHLAALPGPTLFVANNPHDRHRHEQFSKAPPGAPDVAGVPVKALESAAGVMVSDALSDLPTSIPVLRVPDTVKAAMELGIAARTRFAGDVIAITGSVGKSTTVGMLTLACGGQGQAIASIDNYNSRVGVPVTLASLAPDARCAILEVALTALRRPNGPITRLIKPTIALVTEVSLSQIGTTPLDEPATALYKSRIFDGLSGPAIAILGEHIRCFDTVRHRAMRHARRLITFGTSPSATIRLLDHHLNADRTEFTLLIDGKPVDVLIHASGITQVHNATAAICAAWASGVDPHVAAQRLTAFRPVAGRGNVADCHVGTHRIRIVNQAYNANPAAMASAIQAFKLMHPEGGGRRIALLSDMLELGKMAQAEHERLLPLLLDSGIHQVHVCGPGMAHLHALLPPTLQGHRFATPEAMCSVLGKLTSNNDLILAKGSNGTGLYAAINRFIEVHTSNGVLP